MRIERDFELYPNGVLYEGGVGPYESYRVSASGISIKYPIRTIITEYKDTPIKKFDRKAYRKWRVKRFFLHLLFFVLVSIQVSIVSILLSEWDILFYLWLVVVLFLGMAFFDISKSFVDKIMGGSYETLYEY